MDTVQFLYDPFTNRHKGTLESTDKKKKAVGVGGSASFIKIILSNLNVNSYTICLKVGRSGVNTTGYHGSVILCSEDIVIILHNPSSHRSIAPIPLKFL